VALLIDRLERPLPMSDPQHLSVSEIFHSLQGEGARVGVPCVFVRLAGCTLHCNWCDTRYAAAVAVGSRMTIDEVLERVAAFECRTVEVTGGEPLLQSAVYPLMTRLLERFDTVLLETSGSVSIADVDPQVVRIVDIKCPGSGEADRNHWLNIDLLTPRDEVKFVLQDRADYEWAKEIVARHDLTGRCQVIFAPVYERLPLRTLAEWLLADRLDVRLGLQLHKLIWPEAERGV